MIGNVHELPLFSNKGTEMTLTTIAQSLWSLLWPTVFERIVYDQLYPYLEQHDIICKYQSGFRAIHSTVTTLLEATDTWAFNIDLGKINAVVFLCIKKPFDMVDHEILLSKLNFYSINGIAHQWFQSYSEDRTHKCVPSMVSSLAVAL